MMSSKETFMSWFDKTLTKIFMTEQVSAEGFLKTDILALKEIEVPRLIEFLGVLVDKLQNYQDVLKESLDEPEIDIETVDCDDNRKTVDYNVAMETQNNTDDESWSLSKRVKLQDVSVQTVEVVHSCGMLGDNISCGTPVAQVSGNDKPEGNEIPTRTAEQRGDNHNHRQIDENLVQIRASKSEIDRRIAAFVEQKKMAVNELNRREFCSVQGTDTESENSCARVDSLFFTRTDSKSHIKVSRVVNLQGPQTQISHQTLCPTKPTVTVSKDEIPPGIEERISNMEKHLGVGKGRMSVSDVFTRLKVLEERILFLESLSPEYFTYQPPRAKKHKAEIQEDSLQQEENMSITEIDQKIKQLKDSLDRQTPKNKPFSL